MTQFGASPVPLGCYGVPLADSIAATAGGVEVKISVLEERLRQLR